MTSQSLAHARVLVTRPQAQSGEVTQEIENVGGTPIHLPVIKITGREADVLAAEVNAYPRPDIAIFVSRNAVQFGINLISDQDVAIAAIGPSTMQAIQNRGRTVDIYSDSGYDSEHLLAHKALSHVKNKRILILRGDHGRELLASELSGRGAIVRHQAVYERSTADPDPKVVRDVASQLELEQIKYVIVMSVDSLRSLLELLPTESKARLAQSWLVTPSERVIQTAQDLIPGVRALLADGPQATDLVQIMVRHTTIS